MTIGERLEEARKRKGVSIREAAEATKIRGDFLLAMENNSFDINLPDIYVRGFLKIYGSFLKIDLDNLLTDYDAIRLAGRQKLDRRQTTVPTTASGLRRETTGVQQMPAKSSFGRMDLPETQGAAPAAPAAATEPERHPAADEHDVDEQDSRALYYKLGIIIGGASLLVVGIAVLISLLTGNDKPQINPELQAATPATVMPQQSVNRSRLELIADGPVTVIVTQANDNRRLFEGTLSAGERRALDAQGPVTIRYTRGESLRVERGGQAYGMGNQGLGMSRID